MLVGVRPSFPRDMFTKETLGCACRAQVWPCLQRLPVVKSCCGALIVLCAMLVQSGGCQCRFSQLGGLTCRSLYINGILLCPCCAQAGCVCDCFLLCPCCAACCAVCRVAAAGASSICWAVWHAGFCGPGCCLSGAGVLDHGGMEAW
jgi:hypothetical protein